MKSGIEITEKHIHCDNCGYVGPGNLEHWFHSSPIGKRIYPIFTWSTDAIFSWFSYRSTFAGLVVGYFIGAIVVFSKNDKKIFNEALLHNAPMIIGIIAAFLILGGLKTFLSKEYGEEFQKRWRAQVSFGVFLLFFSFALYSYNSNFRPELIQDLRNYSSSQNK